MQPNLQVNTVSAMVCEWDGMYTQSNLEVKTISGVAAG